MFCVVIAVVSCVVVGEQNRRFAAAVACFCDVLKGNCCKCVTNMRVVQCLNSNFPLNNAVPARSPKGTSEKNRRMTPGVVVGEFAGIIFSKNWHTGSREKIGVSCGAGTNKIFLSGAILVATRKPQQKSCGSAQRQVIFSEMQRPNE